MVEKAFPQQNLGPSPAQVTLPQPSSVSHEAVGNSVPPIKGCLCHTCSQNSPYNFLRFQLNRI